MHFHRDDIYWHFVTFEMTLSTILTGWICNLSQVLLVDKSHSWKACTFIEMTFIDILWHLKWRYQLYLRDKFAVCLKFYWLIKVILEKHALSSRWHLLTFCDIWNDAINYTYGMNLQSVSTSSGISITLIIAVLEKHALLTTWHLLLYLSPSLPQTGW